VARLIRTEKEVEGRYEEVWLVVEEDSLDQWPAGPREIVGRDAVRVDGRERATGQAVYTADLAKPGMLHTAVLRSPHPRARVARIDLAPALAMPGVHAAIGPGDIEQLTSDCSFQGEAIAAVCADSLAHARTALRAIVCEFEVLEPLLDPDEAVRQGSLLGEARERSRGDYERGLAEADVVVEAEFRTQVVLHNSMETHQAVVEWMADGVEVHISTQYIWGIRDAVAQGLALPPDKVRIVCHYMGGGFGSKNSPDDYTFIAAELAKRTNRPV
jgi:xanthine dehydrogenase YagR molybdenum-binding subunit